MKLETILREWRLAVVHVPVETDCVGFVYLTVIPDRMSRDEQPYAYIGSKRGHPCFKGYLGSGTELRALVRASRLKGEEFIVDRYTLYVGSDYRDAERKFLERIDAAHDPRLFNLTNGRGAPVCAVMTTNQTESTRRRRSDAAKAWMKRNPDKVRLRTNKGRMTKASFEYRQKFDERMRKRTAAETALIGMRISVGRRKGFQGRTRARTGQRQFDF
jgi:hypothetical protein